jgi:serine/threonine protein kinase
MPPQKNFSIGRRIDGWRLSKYIDSGGSGEVWVATNTAGVEAALKILWNGKYTKRFLDEIKIYRQLGYRPGILHLIDSYTPDEALPEPGGRPWLAMQIGVTITDYLGQDPDLEAVVTAVESYANTLAALAEEGVFHRDIKPSNLYWADGQFAIGDFGIADFPDKAGLTETGEKVGPANFLAPEMIDYSGDVQSGPADVYSLAKTLWAIAAGRRYPLPGELRRDRSNLRLSTHVHDRRALMLEPLLERATSDDWHVRPSMREVADELSWWAERQVAARSDLASYRGEAARLQEATTVVKQETEQERLGRLYGDALQKVHRDLFTYVKDALESAGLQSIQTTPREVMGAGALP